jgi:DMSO/TMAO reductase YedYZ molybdopterin-dependent catalytic subunit
MLAALAMLVVQLAWRTLDDVAGIAGAPSFPETIVAAVARLTPLGVFGWATEKFGSLAQNALFFATLLGIVAVGHEAGVVAARWVAAGRFGGGGGARLRAGLAVAGVLLLVAWGGILVLGGYGAFGTESRHAAAIALQFALTFGLFGALWAVLVGPAPDEAAVVAPGSGAGVDAGASDGAGVRAGAAAGVAVSRRALVDTGAARVAGLALLGGAGALAWRLARPRTVVDPVASEQAARAIEATAEARANGVPTAPTPAPGAAGSAGAPTSAAAPAPPAVDGDAAPAAADASAAMDAEPADAAAVAAQSPGPADGAAAEAPETAALPSFAQLEADGRLTPRLTPLADFYHVSKNIVDPNVSADGWSLRIEGLVDAPGSWTLDELRARATARNITTLGCISNELNGDLISTAEWTGVPLAELLAEVGVQPEAIDLKFSCADDYEDSIPVAQAMDPETLLVVGMNGETLPNDHGFPVRMIVPPIYGMKNVKWLERIELVAEDFQGYWQTRGWSDPAPYQIWGRIDTPRSGEDLTPGPQVAAGMAFAGDRGIERVEVSLDEGATWADAELERSLNAPFTWVRWRFGFEAAQDADLWLRVTDGAGNVAPQEENPPLPDGATGWPRRRLNVA